MCETMPGDQFCFMLCAVSMYTLYIILLINQIMHTISVDTMKKNKNLQYGCDQNVPIHSKIRW